MSKILVETSARHVHVTRETLDLLFGKGYALCEKKRLLQPGQFASEEKVDVVGPKGTIKGVTIIGPERTANQVEVSLTDARVLGVTPPVRESGDTKGSSPIKLVGPYGEAELPEGCIAAKRHIHLNPADAEKFGLKCGQVVSVKISETPRPLIFCDVVVRMDENFAPAMHIDTDESNAAYAHGKVYGEIIV